MSTAVLATADALTNGTGTALLLALGWFTTALLREHIQTIRTSITKENHHERPDA